MSGFGSDEALAFNTASETVASSGTLSNLVPQYSLASAVSLVPGAPSRPPAVETAPRVTSNLKGMGGTIEPDRFTSSPATSLRPTPVSPNALPSSSVSALKLSPETISVNASFVFSVGIPLKPKGSEEGGISLRSTSGRITTLTHLETFGYFPVTTSLFSSSDSASKS